jgi:hypothetical protein
VEAVLLPPLLPVLADVLEQPATIRASMAKAASGRSVLLISSLPCVDWIDAVSMPWRAGHRYILGSCPGSAAHGHAGVIMGFRAQ